MGSWQEIIYGWGLIHGETKSVHGKTKGTQGKTKSIYNKTN